jgi:hypothetical protein
LALIRYPRHRSVSLSTAGMLMAQQYRAVQRLCLPKVIAITALVVAMPHFSIAEEKPVGLIQPITPAEFLTLTEDLQAAYVGGLIEGIAFVQYGYSHSDYPAWVECVRRKTLGDTTKDVVAFIQQEHFNESVSAALAKTMGKRCKH